MVYDCIICNEELETFPPKYSQVGKTNFTSIINNSQDLHVIVVTPCGHVFHDVCIKEWFKSKTVLTCPTCRKIIPSSRTLKRIFPSTADSDYNHNTEGSSSTHQDQGDYELNDLQEIHETLIKDFEEIQKKYNEAIENLNIKDAQIHSCTDMIQHLTERIQILQGEKHKLNETIQNLSMPVPAEPGNQYQFQQVHGHVVRRTRSLDDTMTHAEEVPAKITNRGNNGNGGDSIDSCVFLQNKNFY